MKKLLLIVASMLAFASAQAETSTVDVSKLTPEQQAAIQKSVESMQTNPTATAKNVSETARNETEKWVELGGNMGKAAVGAAREIGMAANEFVSTPLGKVTMGVVIYKVVGRDIIRMIVGFGVLVFFFSLAVYLLRMKRYTDVEYEYKPIWFGYRQKQVVVSGTVDSDWAIGYIAAAFVCVVLGMLVGLNVMF